MTMCGQWSQRHPLPHRSRPFKITFSKINNMKLSENQKLLLKKMRTSQVIYTTLSHRFIFVRTLSRIPVTTARALHNKGIFTIDNDGLCHLTELGKTIDIQ